MPNSSKQFHALMILVGGLYWWLLNWLFTPWLRLIGYVVGRERFTALEQYFFIVFRKPRAAAMQLIPIDPVASAMYLIFCCLGAIPLYIAWTYFQRRRKP